MQVEGAEGRGSSHRPSPHRASLHERESHKDMNFPRWNSPGPPSHPTPGAAENQAADAIHGRTSGNRPPSDQEGSREDPFSLKGNYQPLQNSDDQEGVKRKRKIKPAGVIKCSFS